MPVKTEYQVVIGCDLCYTKWVDAYVRQKEAIKEARREGWRIGKQVLCPECQKRRAE